MASSEVYKVVLSGGAPWGFRLQGGSEFRAPLRIAKITPGSKAQKANIYEGLYVHTINDYPSDKLTHSDALNIVKKTGDELELELCWKPETSSQPTSGSSYTTEDIKSTHISKATFKPSSSDAPPYATLPRGGQGWRDVDENFNETYASEDFPPPPEMPARVFEKPHPVGRGGRRFDDSSNESYGHRPPLTSSSVGSDEDFNMANGDASSQDSGSQHTATRPAMSQFRKQKVNAEIEATREPRPIQVPKKIPPPPPAKPERRYPNIMEEERYKGPKRPSIKKGNRWYKEMFKEMHATAGVSSNLSALLANDAVRGGDEHLGDGPTGEFVHPMQARPVEYEPEIEPNYYDAHTRKMSPPIHREYAPPVHREVTPPVHREVAPPVHREVAPPVHREVTTPVYRSPPPQTSPTSHTHPEGARQAAHDHVPAWYQDMLKGERIPKEEPITYGVHHRKASYDSDEGKSRFAGLQSPVHANRPPDYVPALSRSAADRAIAKPVPTTVTVQQEEKSKPPSATSLYEQRFRGGVSPAHDRNRSASEELGVKHQPPSDEELIRKREEEARQRREEEERRRREEEREMMRRQQEERDRREREAEMRRRKQEAEAAARKASERPQFFAMALYNFTAQTPKELSFKKGDYIVVKRQIDRNWIEGEINGKVGIFPTNHVELRPIDDEEESQEEAPPSPYIPVEGEAKVKYTFQAQTPRELSIGKNEIVTLTRKVDQNWYEGFYQGGRKGIIPAAYLEVLKEPGLAPKGSVSPKATEQPMRQEFVRREEPIKQVHTQPVSHTPQQFTEIRKTTTTTTVDQSQDQPRSYGEPIRIPAQQGRSPPQPQVQYISNEPEPAVLPAQVVEDHEMFPMEGERFKAAYSYVPQNDDELPLEEGEEVIVLEKCDDGWFVGHSIRTGLFGTFPGNYVVAL